MPDPLYNFFAATDINTALLGWVAWETRRAVPYLKALCAHFKIELPRAQTEPAE